MAAFHVGYIKKEMSWSIAVQIPQRTEIIITKRASHLQQKFPEMFSASQKCRAPHLNVDNLRDALFASRVIKSGTNSKLQKI
jgi:Uri superfamily endonuclease